MTIPMDLRGFGPKTLPNALMDRLNRRLPQECQIAQVSIKRLMANGRTAGTWEHTHWVEVFAYTMKPGGTVWVRSIMNESGYFVRTVLSGEGLPADWPGADIHTKRYQDLRPGVLGLIPWRDSER